MSIELKLLVWRPRPSRLVLDLRSENPPQPFRSPSHHRVVIPYEQRIGDRSQEIHPPFGGPHSPVVLDAGSDLLFGKRPATDALQLALRVAHDQFVLHDLDRFDREAQIVWQSTPPDELVERPDAALVSVADRVHRLHASPPLRPVFDPRDRLPHRLDRRRSVPDGDERVFHLCDQRFDWL